MFLRIFTSKYFRHCKHSHRVGPRSTNPPSVVSFMYSLKLTFKRFINLYRFCWHLSTKQISSGCSINSIPQTYLFMFPQGQKLTSLPTQSCSFSTSSLLLWVCIFLSATALNYHNVHCRIILTSPWPSPWIMILRGVSVRA